MPSLYPHPKLDVVQLDGLDGVSAIPDTPISFGYTKCGLLVFNESYQSKSKVRYLSNLNQLRSDRKRLWIFLRERDVQTHGGNRIRLAPI